jgi:hypothetical protein
MSCSDHPRQLRSSQRRSITSFSACVTGLKIRRGLRSLTQRQMRRETETDAGYQYPTAFPETNIHMPALHVPNTPMAPDKSEDIVFLHELFPCD